MVTWDPHDAYRRQLSRQSWPLTAAFAAAACGFVALGLAQLEAEELRAEKDARIASQETDLEALETRLDSLQELLGPTPCRRGPDMNGGTVTFYIVTCDKEMDR